MKRFLFFLPFLLAFTCEDRNDSNNDACVDYDAINQDAICTEEYMPVCGCNRVTYSNTCKASTAGVKSYTEGACSSQDVENAFQLWTTQTNQNYSFDLLVTCFCIYEDPFSITVVNGEAVAVSPYNEPSYEQIPLTIDALFVEIKKRMSENPFQYDLVFDKELGYPVQASFDMNEAIADEEIIYTVQNLQFADD